MGLDQTLPCYSKINIFNGGMCGIYVRLFEYLKSKLVRRPPISLALKKVRKLPISLALKEIVRRVERLLRLCAKNKLMERLLQPCAKTKLMERLLQPCAAKISVWSAFCSLALKNELMHIDIIAIEFEMV